MIKGSTRSITASTRKTTGSVSYPAGIAGSSHTMKGSASKVKGSTKSGLKARNNGHKFEHIIDITCRLYQKKGLGLIQKTPEPMKVIKSKGNGQFTCIFEKKAQPDYTGVLAGGVSIMFEAKHTDGKRFPFNRINDEQWDVLTSHHAYGGKTYVLLRFNTQDYYCVPFGDWIKLTTASKKKSVNESELSDYTVPYKNGFVDFLRLL